VLNGHVITRALGDTAVTGAVVSACDDDWAPRPATERRFDADAVVVGYGFVPSTDLPRLAGCDLHYAHDVGGHVPVLDGDLQTSVAGVFVAGEADGVAGSAVALEEGRLAGLAAARHLGRIDAARFRALAAPVRKRLSRLAGFRAVMDELYRLRPGLGALAAADTVVCRCEELCAGDIRRAIEEGAHLLNEVKIFTRAGMGRCQGRMCGPAIAAMISRATGAPPEAPGAFTARTPVKPVSLAALAGVAAAHD
jgi:NAD(P)H-nitrite reductase large subunit